MKDLNKKIGARIKDLRIKNNLTQQELADKLHYKSRSTINKIELGINVIHPTKLRGFAYALNTTEEYILGFTNYPGIYYSKIEFSFKDGSFLKYVLNKEETEKTIQFLNSFDNQEKNQNE